MRSKNACEIVYGDNNNIGVVINYLLLLDCVWANTENSPLLNTETTTYKTLRTHARVASTRSCATPSSYTNTTTQHGWLTTSLN